MANFKLIDVVGDAIVTDYLDYDLTSSLVVDLSRTMSMVPFLVDATHRRSTVGRTSNTTLTVLPITRD